ncbi:hypothetical protein P3L10_027856 [Capsicum annuum]
MSTTTATSRNPDLPPPPPPPDPPDLTPAAMEEDPPKKMSYKEANEEHPGLDLGNVEALLNFKNLKTSTVDSDGNPIQLTDEDKQRLYSPWKRSVILKCVGRRLNHQYLRSKLMDLWKL